LKYADAKIIADDVVAQLAPYCERIEIAGSVRRKCEEVGDIEIVCIRRGKDLIKFADIVDSWGKIRGEVIGKYCARTYRHIQIDLFMCDAKNWGYIFAIRTGSAFFSHNVLAKAWVAHGYRGIEGSLCNGGKPVEVREEKELFAMIGVPWVEPEKRF
jgi:DNA polymerase/3'-5' exonuclease PolX